jgi:hypothetical protein
VRGKLVEELMRRMPCGRKMYAHEIAALSSVLHTRSLHDMLRRAARRGLIKRHKANGRYVYERRR